MNSKVVFLFALFFFLSFFLGCGRQSDTGQSGNTLYSGAIIVGDLDWKDVTTLVSSDPIRVNSKKVADLDLPAIDSRCTGFLIGEDVLITNHHCVTQAADAAGATANFGHETGASGNSLKFDCSEFIGNDEEFDFALLRCKGKPGKALGTVTLSSQSLASGDRIYVIQQNCDYYQNRSCDWSKKYAKGQITGKNSDGDYKHNADTLGGSSGSPVFLESSNLVVALHHAGYGNNGQGRGVENYAVPMGKVMGKIKTAFPEIARQIGLGGSTPPSSQEPFEPNDSFASAALVQLPFSNGLLKVSSSADVDWFKFSVTLKSNVSVKVAMAKAAGDLDLQLYTSGGKLVAKSDGTSQSEAINLSLAAGVYYVKVYGYKGATNDYSLSIAK